MSKYKYLILTDLDSTLLNSAGELSQRAKDYIAQLNSRGDVLFSFSTGRPLLYSTEIYEALNMDCFISCNNGSLICNPKRNLFRYNYISDHFVETALTDAGFLENFLDGVINSDQRRYSYEKSEIPQVLDFLKSSGAGVYSCRFQFVHGADEKESDRRLDEKMIFLKSLGYNLSIIAYKYPDCISMEVISRLSSKNASAEFLAGYYGVAPENVLTFGDQINDLSVAMGNTRFVAMANSVEILKQHSRIISRYTNDEDGVVRELEEFFRDKRP